MGEYMKLIFTALLFLTFLTLPTLTFSQTQQQKVAGAIETARQQVENSQSAGFEQARRDAILGHASKHDFDNLGTIILITFVVFVGWNLFKHSKEKKEIGIGAQKLKEEYEAQRAERLKTRREATATLEKEAIKYDKEKLKRANDMYTSFLFKEKKDGAKNRIYIKFLTDQQPKDDFWELFDIYVACFDKDKKIAEDYGVHSNYTNATDDEDDSKYESILFDWDLRSDIETQCYKTLDIRVDEFPPTISFIAIYLANGAKQEDCLKEFSIEVRLNGLDSNAEIFKFSPNPSTTEALLNIGYLQRNDSNWEFKQIKNRQVNITHKEFTEDRKQIILARFQESFIG